MQSGLKVGSTEAEALAGESVNEECKVESS